MSGSKYKPRLPIAVIGPSIAYIVLTQGQYALIDAEDSANIAQHNWFAYRDRHTRGFYARRSEGGKVTRFMHHHCFEVVPKGFVVDHINRNSLDQRKSNLRLCTHSENNINKGLQVNNSSGSRGVSRNGRGWQAYISSGGRRQHIGTYPSIEEASAAYAARHNAIYGSFQNL